MKRALRTLWPWMLGVFAFSGCWLACNSLLGIDPPELGDAGPPSCHARWPARPDVEDGDGSPDRTLIFAVNYVSFDAKAAGSPLGYDLDDTCSCLESPPGPESCNRHVGARTPRCDEPGGRDIALNAAGIALLEQAKGFNEELLREGLRNGSYGMLVVVSGYNGGKNDRNVRVSFFTSSGFVAGDAGVEAGAAPGQAWDIDPSSVLGADAGVPADAGFEARARFVDESAYVSGGVLVSARLNGSKLMLGAGVGQVVLDFSEAVATAKLEKDLDGNMVLSDGLIAARWPTKNLLKTVAGLQDPIADAGRFICDDKLGISYGIAKGTICTAADITSNVALDNTTNLCDAISVGLRFAARRATFGKERATTPAKGPGCWQTWSDDCAP